MLKTNTKIVKERVKSHILDYYTIEEFKAQVEAMGRSNNYQNIVKMVYGGCFACYYNQARETIKNWLEENDEEASKFDDTKVWNLYVHLIALNGEKLINEYANRVNMARFR